MDNAELQNYVAHCASCGLKLKFFASSMGDSIEEMEAECSCGKKWSFIFHKDKSGTFGVMAFQCDNGDRII
jgi:hypothetical protein